MKGVAALLLIANTNAITLESDPMFSSLGYETRHYKGEGDYDDYTVPHFGTDTDVVTTLKNAADAEKKAASAAGVPGAARLVQDFGGLLLRVCVGATNTPSHLLTVSGRSSSSDKNGCVASF